MAVRHWLLTAILSGLCLLSAATADAAIVTATGQGGDERSALHAAMRAAVEQEVGVYLDSSTRIQNYRVLQDSVYTKSEGYISHYDIIKQEVIGGIYRTTIRADVNAELLQSGALSRLQKKALVEANLEDPRIAVLAMGQNGHSYPALENALIATMQDEGYSRLIDLGTAAASARRTALLAAQTGDRDTLLRLHSEAQADYLLIVRVAEDTKSFDCILPGLHKIYLSAAARLVNTSTGEIRWTGNADSESEGWYGNGESEAIKGLVEKLTPSLSRAALNQAADVEQHIRLTAPLAHFGTTASARDALAAIPGVQHVYIRAVTLGTLTADLDFDGTAADLTAALERSGYTAKRLSSESIELQ